MGIFQHNLEVSLRVGFGIVLAVSLSVFGLAFVTARNDIAAGNLVDHTNTVLRTATECLTTLADMEDGYNDFALSGLPGARVTYDQDLQSIHAQLAGLSELTADNPPQVERWRAIDAQVDGLNATLSPQMSSDFASGTVDAAQIGVARSQFAAVRDALSVPIGVERDLLVTRSATAEQDDVRLEFVLVGGGITILALGLLCAAVLSNTVVKPVERLAQVAQAIANGDLGQRVALDRADGIGRAAAAFDCMADSLQRDLERRAHMQAETDSVLNAAGEGIFGLDARGCITMMNRAAETMTGYSFDEVQGQSLHTTLHHSRPDGTPLPADQCPAVLAVRDGKSIHLRHDVYWRKDGSSLPVSLTGVPIMAGGSTAGAVMTFHDIAEQLAIDQMKDEFIGVVSHELRTPLTSIRGSLGLLSAGVLGELPPQAGRMISIALDNTERLVRLVSDILDIERIESGKLVLQLEPADTRQIAERCIEGMTAVASSARIDLICEAESIVVQVDVDRILQALTNLIGNAIKFSSPGSQVIITVQNERDRARFSVADRGRGIPAEKLEAIFRRFEQVDVSDAKHKGGTGLGLPIARSIIRQHGGEMSVQSRPGEGSTFSFTLPVAS